MSGAEYLLCAGSIEQARLCFRFIRAALEDSGEYRFLDSVTRIGVVHKRTNTRLRILSSNGKTAMGIVGCPLLVADEPGSWEVNGGTLHAFPQVTYIQLPPFEELRYVSHTLHHRQSISFTEYRNSSAGSFYVGFTLALV